MNIISCYDSINVCLNINSLVNGQFSLICPMFTVSKLNMLEKRFLEFLDYDVNISSRLYAKYALVLVFSYIIFCFYNCWEESIYYFLML